jgi:hypothetical protein
VYDKLHKIPYSLPLASANGLMIKHKLALAKNIDILLAKANSNIQSYPLAEANGNECKSLLVQFVIHPLKPKIIPSLP